MFSSEETETETESEDDEDAFAFISASGVLPGGMASQNQSSGHFTESSGASDTESEDEFDAEDPFVSILPM